MAKESDDRVPERAEPDDSLVRDASPSSVDPEVLTVQGRRESRLADTTHNFSVDALPAPLTECGCGECPDAVDPLEQSTERTDNTEVLDTTFLDTATWAKGACDEPRLSTLERAREVF